MANLGYTPSPIFNSSQIRHREVISTLTAFPLDYGEALYMPCLLHCTIHLTPHQPNLVCTSSHGKNQKDASQESVRQNTSIGSIKEEGADKA